MRRTAMLLLAALLLGTVLAGCLQGDDAGSKSATEAKVRHRAPGVPTYIVEQLPDPVLKCFDATVCNQEMTPDEGRQGNEVTIAVNPTNPKNIVGGAKDYFPPDAGECVWDGVYVTTNGGQSYEDRSFDGSPWRALADPQNFKPNYASQFWCTTDPVVYFNTKGTFYYLLMAYQADRVTGSKTCKDVCPQGALNDWAFNRAVQIVATSLDGGKTFTTFTPVFEGSFPVDFHDKGWIAASNDGIIHVMWLASLAPGNFYWRSVDGGKSFQDPQILANTVQDAGQGSFLDVGPGKEVYASWQNGRDVMLRRSLDEGQSWDPARAVIQMTPKSMPGLSDRDRRSGFPTLATDKYADSPYHGAVYFVWQDARISEGNSTDIFFSASFDNGTTFTDPIPLNDDYGADGKPDVANWQIFPTISVSPLGVIDVSWMDSRLGGTATLAANNGGTASLVGTEHARLDQYYTYSLDGGKTWSRNFRVRDVDDRGWDPALSHHQNGKIFIGDYNDIDSSWGAAHPVWPDTRSGKAVDVYTAVIQRPIFPDGIDAAKKADLRQRLVAEKLVDPDHPFLDQ